MILRTLVGLAIMVFTVALFTWPIFVWGIQIGSIVIFCTWGFVMVLGAAWTIGDTILEKHKEDRDGS